jgi:hypothetical protein
VGNESDAKIRRTRTGLIKTSANSDGESGEAGGASQMSISSCAAVEATFQQARKICASDPAEAPDD